MKSRMLHIVEFATSEIGLIFLLLTLAVAIASVPAHAQDNTWTVDREHSMARLSLGSNPKSVEIGLAHVSGNVVFGAAGDPQVNLNFAAGKNQGADPVEISFKSKRSTVTDDGKIAVVGELSVTRVERSVNLDPSEGYYGATYGEPVVSTATREVTLVLPAEPDPGAQTSSVELLASTRVSREYFPELLSAMSPGNWSNLEVEDESCTVRAATGEGYYGATCTGTPVETATNSVAPATPTSGEGYYGFETAVIPDGGQATIAFDLRLTRAASSMSAASSASAGN